MGRQNCKFRVQVWNKTSMNVKENEVIEKDIDERWQGKNNTDG